MSRVLNITVMLGGPSAEREVSLRSGASVSRALRSRGHEVHELDPRNADWKLPSGTEVVFLALHGTYGEDGTVQQQLDRRGVPYTGCDAAASRLGFDKILTKKKCIEKLVPTARFEVFSNPQVAWPQGWEPPVVLKPVRQGSSVGLQFVEKISDWPDALAGAMKFDSEVLMEEKIVGRETTVAILGDMALPIVEVRPKSGNFDYKNKYTAGATEHICPAEFSREVTLKIQQAALGAFQAIGGRDYSRVDVMVRPNGDPVVLEVNTLPGMTELSLFPEAAAAAGIGYAELCEKMVLMAMARSV